MQKDESQDKPDKISKKWSKENPSILVTSFKIDPFPTSQIGTQKQLQVLDILQTLNFKWPRILFAHVLQSKNGSD